MLYTVAIVFLLVLATFLYMQHPLFGKAPSKEQKKEFLKSENFQDGIFKNQTDTPDLSEGYSMIGIIYDQLFGKHPRKKPQHPIPSTKTNLKSLDPAEDILVWFGHSSYFMQLDGKTFLVDPVFSGNASPIPGTVTSFKGTERYSVTDLPEIDFLFISHDHYDHLDYKTISQLREKTKKVYCGLGVGSHFKRWGYSDNQIYEQDWYDQSQIDSALTIYTFPARHFSGRGFSAKNTLWASYVIETPSLRIYIGGDSGYDSFFKEIGDQFDGIDLAILDNGQYNKAWAEIHMHPEEVLKAAKDLKATRLFPVHSSKFVLAMHPWDEPLKEVDRLNQGYSIDLVTPLIGEKVDLNDTTATYSNWWEDIDG